MVEFHIENNIPIVGDASLGKDLRDERGGGRQLERPRHYFHKVSGRRVAQTQSVGPAQGRLQIDDSRMQNEGQANCQEGFSEFNTLVELGRGRE